MTTKPLIRKSVAAAVAALTSSERQAAAFALGKQVLSLPWSGRPGVVAAYMPLPDEIDTLPLIAGLAGAGWKVVIPKVKGEEMEFYPYFEESLVSGSWGIMEPETTLAPVSASEIDVMIVPGRAFTPLGDRLGRGKGFYDRYMSRDGFRARTVGVCFKCQIMTVLPVEPHDRKVDEVLALTQFI